MSLPRGYFYSLLACNHSYVLMVGGVSKATLQFITINCYKLEYPNWNSGMEYTEQ